jgi:hypothetical protein
MLTIFLLSFTPFYFIHYSDPQIGRNAYTVPYCSLAVSQISALSPPPNFILIAGDLANDPDNSTLVQEEWRICDSLFGLLSIPIHVAPGNNDLGYEDEGCWTPALLQLYRNFWGPDYYSFESDSCHFVALNSTLLDTYSGHACYTYSLEQDSFLRYDLQNTPAASYRHLFMFFHFPLYQTSPGEGNSHSVVDRPRRDSVLADLIQYQATAVFTGHWHIDWMNFYGPALLESGLATCETSMGSCGYRIVKVLDNGVETFHVLLTNPITGVSLNRIVTADAAPDSVQAGQTVNFTCLVDSINNPSWQGLSYFWGFGDNDSALTPNANHVYADSGHYRVILRAYKRHDLCALYYLPVVVTSGQTVAESQIPANIGKPYIMNVIGKSLVLNMPDDGPCRVTLFSADGRGRLLLDEVSLKRGRRIYNLPIDLPSGVYFIHMTGDKFSFAQKFVYIK